MTKRRTAELTSRVMAAVKRRDTRAELQFRRALFARGFRYRVDDAAVVGRPDVAFRTEKVAVFVDGDFWHGNAWKARGFAGFDEQFTRWKRPGFWRKKLLRNMERDLEVNAALKNQGWLVLRFWESDLQRDQQRAVNKTIAAVLRRRRHP